MFLFMVILFSFGGRLFKAGSEPTLVMIQSSECTVLVSVFLHAFLFQNCKNMVYFKNMLQRLHCFLEHLF